MNDTAVCVVIVNHNSGTMLTDCVMSVLASTVPVRVYVSDNGSGDDSIAHLRAALRDDPRVRIVCNGANLGFAKGNNVVFPLCQSEYVLCLNPDAVVAADCLQKLLQVAGQHPDAACFAARMIQSQRRDLLDGEGDAYHVSGLAWRRGHGSPVTANARAGTAEVFSACAAAALYRRTALEAVGGFDEDFFCYLEDVDLGFRLRLEGYRCLYVPDAVAYHIGSATTGSDSDFVVYHVHRNLVWTYVKNMPSALLWLYMPQHVVVNVGSVVWYAFKGRWRVILKAKWDAMKGLRRMWRKRGDIQRRRVVRAWLIRQMMHRGLARREPFGNRE